MVGRLEGIMMKRVTLTLLILAVVTSCLACPRTSLAGAKYSGGTGDANDPYQIATAADLLALAGDANDYNKCFILTADIDLDPNLPGNFIFTTAVIAPDMNTSSGFQGVTFAGIFDGEGHKISNLVIDTNVAGHNYLGLFGDVNGGEIKNLDLQNVSVTSANFSNSFGGLVGYNGSGTISRCTVTGIVIGGDTSGYLGGLVGYNYFGIIRNCSFTGAVFGKESSHHLGGLIGGNINGNINNCFSTVDVNGGLGSEYLGGLVG
ncbi:MAG: hypothetical protein MUO27_10645, partial [Sedimentisphaerales bacterium]|nr:hypothetical protein [Sedimentisphaerales bacterium]